MHKKHLRDLTHTFKVYDTEVMTETFCEKFCRSSYRSLYFSKKRLMSCSERLDRPIKTFDPVQEQFD